MSSIISDDTILATQNHSLCMLIHPSFGDTATWIGFPFVEHIMLETIPCEEIS